MNSNKGITTGIVVVAAAIVLLPMWSWWQSARAAERRAEAEREQRASRRAAYCLEASAWVDELEAWRQAAASTTVRDSILTVPPVIVMAPWQDCAEQPSYKAIQLADVDARLLFKSHGLRLDALRQQHLRELAAHLQTARAALAAERP